MKATIFIFLANTAVAYGDNIFVPGTVPSCDLQCANGSYCTFIEGTTEQLARRSQSGYLIEACVCPPGFTGTACEREVEKCSLPERKCNNGEPCSRDKSGRWGCDCAIADSLSSFAGRMCRDPITEYCSGKFQPGQELSFCTNGGRCIGDFIAAKVAPGDTSVNAKYQ